MSLKRIRVQASRLLFTRRGACITFIIFIWFLFYHLPDPPSTQNNTRADRPPPEHQVEDTPRFLYRSPFRNNPDIQYEKQLSNALEEIEQAVLEIQESNISEDRIWQIAKNEKHRGDDSIVFEGKHKEWEYTLVSDKRATEFVANELSAIPEIATIYKSYPRNVLRADLLRYLILWYYGGFYADIDVFPARTIKTCPALEPFFAPPPDEYTESTPHPDVSLVVGIEVDEPYASQQFMHDWHWTRSYGLIQYTMYAPRRFSPLLRETIVRVLSHTRQYNSQHSSFVPRLAYDEKTILGVTGPDVFTDAILDTLSSSLPLTHPFVRQSVDADADIGDLLSAELGDLRERVTWAPFHRLRDPVCIQADEAAPNKSMGGICVLPISVWGNGQRHSQAGGFNHPNACVNHRFGRTWKKGWWEYIFG